MKKSEFQKFIDFKKRHNFTNQFIAQLMHEYATSDDEFSCSYFVNKYGISEHTFYKMRDYAVIFMLVSPNTCKEISKKCNRNQRSKNPYGNFTSSPKHYKDLLEKRKEYLSTFSYQEILEVAIEYAQWKPINDIALTHGVSKYIIQNLIAIALKNHIVNYQTYRAIKVRSDTIAKTNPLVSCTAKSLWDSYKTK